MVGGIVVEIIEMKDGRKWVNTCDHGEMGAIFVSGEHDVKKGDTVWWHGEHFMWTKRQIVGKEEKHKRLSYSHESRPPYEERVNKHGETNNG